MGHLSVAASQIGHWVLKRSVFPQSQQSGLPPIDPIAIPICSKTPCAIQIHIFDFPKRDWRSSGIVSVWLVSRNSVSFHRNHFRTPNRHPPPHTTGHFVSKLIGITTFPTGVFELNPLSGNFAHFDVDRVDNFAVIASSSVK